MSEPFKITISIAIRCLLGKFSSACRITFLLSSLSSIIRDKSSFEFTFSSSISIFRCLYPTVRNLSIDLLLAIFNIQVDTAPRSESYEYALFHTCKKIYCTTSSASSLSLSILSARLYTT